MRFYYSGKFDGNILMACDKLKIVSYIRYQLCYNYRVMPLHVQMSVCRNCACVLQSDWTLQRVQIAILACDQTLAFCLSLASPAAVHA